MHTSPYWRRQIRRTLWLLAVWAVVAFGCSILFVEWMNQFSLGGVPLGFWMAQQGSIFVFVVLILLFAVLTGRAERERAERERAHAEGQPSASHD